MELFAGLLLILGSALLLAAVWPVWRLILQLPPGGIRSSWRLLSVLLYFFIGGYLLYSFLFWGDHAQLTDLIVPLIFFFGAVFVLLVSTLSLTTANDIKRIFTLEYESTTDPLLGIYNRRYLEKRLHEEFFRSKRYGFPLSVLLLDIDHFKLVNDRWGHPIGDLILKRLATLIITTVREADVVARYGGEEILVILPHTAGGKSLLLAERLRAAIETFVMVTAEENDNQEEVTVTASLGVSMLVDSMTSCQQLVKQADKSLYFAKGRGRNMVVGCPHTEKQNN